MLVSTRRRPSLHRTLVVGQGTTATLFLRSLHHFPPAGHPTLRHQPRRPLSRAPARRCILTLPRPQISGLSLARMIRTSIHIPNLRHHGTLSSTPRLLGQGESFATQLYPVNTLEKLRTPSALKHMQLLMMINMVTIVLNRKICRHLLYLASSRKVRESGYLITGLCLAPRAFVGYRGLQEQVAGLRHKRLRTDTLVHRHLIYHLALHLHNQVHTEADIKDSVCFHVPFF